MKLNHNKISCIKLVHLLYSWYHSFIYPYLNSTGNRTSINRPHGVNVHVNVLQLQTPNLAVKEHFENACKFTYEM